MKGAAAMHGCNRESDIDLQMKMARMIGLDIEDEDDAELYQLLPLYLDAAASRVLNRRYPFGIPRHATVEPQYRNAQLEIAVFLWGKRGFEGESLHSENGINRSFGGVMDVPPELLQQVTPKGRVY